MAACRRGREVLGLLFLAASTTLVAADAVPAEPAAGAAATRATVFPAGSVDAGRSLYAAICAGCHGALTPLVSPAAAADAPSRIRTAINPQATMGFLSFLSDQDLADIASYIARPTTTDIDRLLDWAEQAVLPDYLGTPAAPSEWSAGYRYRYYPRPAIYVGSRDGIVYLLDALTLQLGVVGSLRQLLAELPTGR